MTTVKNTLNKKHSKYVGELKKSLEEGMVSVQLSLDAAKEPFNNIDTVVTRLTEMKKDELVDKALQFSKTVASDIDEYKETMGAIQDEVKRIVENPPNKGRHIGGYAMQTFAVGQQILQLNERIITTTIAVADDYVQLLKESGLEEG